MIARLSACLLLMVAAIPLALGQDSAPSEPATASAPADRKLLKLPGMEVDLAARRIILDATVCKRSGGLELLVCKAGTKEYESIMSSKVDPSRLHAGLLALGLAPGKHGQWTGGGDTAVYIPPRGAEMTITLRWTDKDGKAREADASEWLSATGKGGKNVAAPKKWIFVGSEELPGGGYWADSEGDMICVSNFSSSVIDVPFESTSSNELLDFAANEPAIPPEGTAVKVVITPLAGAENAPDARATLDIDCFGQMSIAGKPISLDKLSFWANDFTNKHSKGMVVIRSEGRTTIGDIERAKSLLRIGGVREFDEERPRSDGEVLPRTKEQEQAAMQEWAAKFASPGDYITPPQEQAQAVLAQIDGQLRELAAAGKLLAEYRADLEKAVAAYQSSTQPASQPASAPAEAP